MDGKEELVNWLPVEQLWPLLIAVSCQHTGQERLKVIGLLMDIVCLMSEGADEKWKAKLKLSALKPLWQLHTRQVRGWAGLLLLELRQWLLLGEEVLLPPPPPPPPPPPHIAKKTSTQF